MVQQKALGPKTNKSRIAGKRRSSSKKTMANARKGIKLYYVASSGRIIAATGRITVHSGAKASATVILRNLKIDKQTINRADKILKEGKYIQKNGHNK